MIRQKEFEIRKEKREESERKRRGDQRGGEESCQIDLEKRN